MKIAVTGKGGVGKTTISGFIIDALRRRGRRVLAIDSDPSPHLARVLGFPDADEIVPIAEMTELLQERTQRNGPFYNINPKVDDLPARFMRQQGNVRLMVLGAVNKGGGGCACAENAVLRNLLNLLVLSEDEDIVLDMEAGVEHLGRGTIQGVDHLLIVVQPYRGSLETARKIERLAADLGIPTPVLVANGIADQEDLTFIESELGRRPAVAFPEDRKVTRAERSAEPVYSASQEMRERADELVSTLEAMGRD